MTDTERLAALLHDIRAGCLEDLPNDPVSPGDDERTHRKDARRLLAAGVRLSPDDGPLRAALEDMIKMALNGAAHAHLDGAGIMQDPPHGPGIFAECQAPWCVRNRARLDAAHAALAATPVSPDRPPPLPPANPSLLSSVEKIATPGDARETGIYPGMKVGNGGNDLTPSDARERPVALDEALLTALSEEQRRIVVDLTASRQQTVAEWFSDVVMEMGLGRAGGKEYPAPVRAATTPEPTP